jgi:DNA gyrase subunit B
MPELVQKGYIYAAEPPLYGVTQGKRLHYIKDEAELQAHLLQIAVSEDAYIYPQPGVEPICGDALRDLLVQYQSIQMTAERLRYPSALIAALLETPPLSVEQLSNESLMQQWRQQWQQTLDRKFSAAAIEYKVELQTESDEMFLPVVALKRYGLTHHHVFGHAFFQNEYLKISKLAEKLALLIAPNAYVQRDGKQKNIQNFQEAYAWLMDAARSSVTVQRYKGLGEMNEDQLWDTTMDPTKRRLSQVTLANPEAAAQIITMLMGHDVEPRRLFIEQNALNEIHKES